MAKKRYLLRCSRNNWKTGWEKIIDLKLSEEEQETFNKSADAVRGMNDVLKTM